MEKNFPFDHFLGNNSNGNVSLDTFQVHQQNQEDQAQDQPNEKSHQESLFDIENSSNPTTVKANSKNETIEKKRNTNRSNVNKSKKTIKEPIGKLKSNEDKNSNSPSSDHLAQEELIFEAENSNTDVSPSRSNEKTVQENFPPPQTIENSSNSSGSVTETLDTNEHSAILQQILISLKETIPIQKLQTYFNENFQLIKIDDKFIYFQVPTNFIKNVIETKYAQSIKDSIVSVLGRPYSIQILVFPIKGLTSQASLRSGARPSFIKAHKLNRQQQVKEYFQDFSASTVKDARFTIDLIPSQDDLLKQVDSTVMNHMRESSFGSFIDYKKTFDNFIVGPSNNMAYASALAVTKNPGKVYPSLYLYGDSGLGKTHLLHAIANNIREMHPYLKLCMTTARDFMTEMVDAMAEKRVAEFRKKYSEKVDVLMIDDVHELKNKIGTQNEFFHVFNELHNKGKQLIFTSDKPPKEIHGLEERIRTRLSWGLVLDIQQPEIETRTAILKKKAIQEDIYLPEDVVQLMANSIVGNIRELEGSLIRLAAYASVMSVDIDIEIARKQLKLANQLKLGTPRLTTNGSDLNNHIIIQPSKTEMIIRIVSDHFNIPVADVISKVRHRQITEVRHLAMFLSYKFANETLAQIGDLFGNRDHSSVLHAVAKIKKRIVNDPSLSQSITELEQKITNLTSNLTLQI